MHQALYRKWRPQSFDQVYGQEHITSILKYETEKGLFCHAYLFCGSRGTGKTTCAKILARAVNCHDPQNGNPCGVCESCRSIASGMTTDILEMDAASNNKVDDIRSILDEVIYTPTSMKYRVYIIDEVHMLSSSAFNALLKTLEEPPEHVIFILATTEMQKLPATIISRCQRFDFRRIASSVLVERLKYISKEENIPLEDDAALMLARLAQGGMRDAISLFELCAAGGRAVTADAVSETVGVCGREAMSRTVRAIYRRDAAALFDIIAGIDSSAKDIGVFWQELIGYYRDMLVLRTATPAAAVKYLDLTDSETEMLRADADAFRRETLSYHCRLLDDAYTAMQRPGASRRTVAELTLIRLCDEKLGTSPEALIARISALEARLAAGVPAPAPASASASASASGSAPIPSSAASNAPASNDPKAPNAPVTSAPPVVTDEFFPEPPPDPMSDGHMYDSVMPPFNDEPFPASSSGASQYSASAPYTATSPYAENSPYAAPSSSAGYAPSSASQQNRRADAQMESQKQRSAARPGERILRPLRQWKEIVDGFRAESPAIAALLDSERAFTDDSQPGKIIICYSKELTKMMVTPPPTFSAFCAKASLVLDRPVDDKSVVFEKVAADQAPSNSKILIDELSEMAEHPEQM